MKARHDLAEHYRGLLFHAIHVTARHEVLPRTLFSFRPDRLVGYGIIVVRVDLVDLRAVDRARVSILLVVAKHLSPEKEKGSTFDIEAYDLDTASSVF